MRADAFILPRLRSSRNFLSFSTYTFRIIFMFNIGFSGWGVCVAYLILGSLVTKVKMLEKEKLGIAEKRQGRRGPENVWGSAAVAMICAILSYVYPYHCHLFELGFVASLATKLSDTFQSEIGKAYGKTAYLVTTLKRVERGTEGAVSLEGTLAGIVGSLLLSTIAVFSGLAINSIEAFAACNLAAFLACYCESYIGATYQSDKFAWLSNELVNLINCAIGAFISIVLYTFFTSSKFGAVVGASSAF